MAMRCCKADPWLHPFRRLLSRNGLFCVYVNARVRGSWLLISDVHSIQHGPQHRVRQTPYRKHCYEKICEVNLCIHSSLAFTTRVFQTADVYDFARKQYVSNSLGKVYSAELLFRGCLTLLCQQRKQRWSRDPT